MIKDAVSSMMKKYGAKALDAVKRNPKTAIASGAAATGAAAAYGSGINSFIRQEGVELGNNGTLRLTSPKTGDTISMNINRLKDKGYSDGEILKVAKYTLKNGRLPKGLKE